MMDAEGWLRKPQQLGTECLEGKVRAALRTQGHTVINRPSEKNQSRLPPVLEHFFLSSLEMVIRDHHVSLIAYVCGT